MMPLGKKLLHEFPADETTGASHQYRVFSHKFKNYKTSSKKFNHESHENQRASANLMGNSKVKPVEATASKRSNYTKEEAGARGENTGAWGCAG
jgi:hypothetical protein